MEDIDNTEVIRHGLRKCVEDIDNTEVIRHGLRKCVEDIDNTEVRPYTSRLEEMCGGLRGGLESRASDTDRDLSTSRSCHVTGVCVRCPSCCPGIIFTARKCQQSQGTDRENLITNIKETVAGVGKDISSSYNPTLHIVPSHSSDPDSIIIRCAWFGWLAI